MTKKVPYCNKMNFISNLNEVIRAVLNSVFLQKIFARTKSTKRTKVQRLNQAKAQNTTSKQQ